MQIPLYGIYKGYNLYASFKGQVAPEQVSLIEYEGKTLFFIAINLNSLVFLVPQEDPADAAKNEEKRKARQRRRQQKYVVKCSGQETKTFSIQLLMFCFFSHRRGP